MGTGAGEIFEFFSFFLALLLSNLNAARAISSASEQERKD